jgi:hypothetical protein
MRFAALATSPSDLLLSFHVHGDHPYGAEVVLQSLTNDGPFSGTKAIRHAPIIGPNLTGYTISSVTQTFNSLLVEPNGSNRYRLTGNTTIRIYGDVVPEPASWAHVSVAFIATVSLARKR